MRVTFVLRDSVQVPPGGVVLDLSDVLDTLQQPSPPDHSQSPHTLQPYFYTQGQGSCRLEAMKTNQHAGNTLCAGEGGGGGSGGGRGATSHHTPRCDGVNTGPAVSVGVVIAVNEGQPATPEQQHRESVTSWWWSWQIAASLPTPRLLCERQKERESVRVRQRGKGGGQGEREGERKRE